ncbi:hypothetical protein [Acetobacter ghanensis]|uniref:Uncharacterized protein n=1 Tax=Acetobacter ghanensis TaxID=431306 RepID=A0A0U5F616_9PROT|nr:hypothetical protein [Acetobacter ghanensis]NHO38136.1 hypothetical protein [Acetobacter ghanensis]CEF56023.1 hypothetical protein predicted by Glimmer/Critica [Acetobacter ghanensis]
MVTQSGLVLLSGGGCTAASGVLFYLSSKHQRLVVHRPNHRLCLFGATGMGILAVSLLGCARSVTTACFMVVLLLMLVCCFFPLFMATLQFGKKRP